MMADADLRSSRPNRILICRTDHLGDVLLSLPCILLVKRMFPDCQVDFLVQSYTAPLFKIVPFVDSIFKIDGGTPVKQIGEMLRPERFDAAVALYPEFRLARALRGAGIGVRSGTAYRWYSPLFTYRHKEHRKSNLKHELEYNLSLTYATFFRGGRWEDVLSPGSIFPLDLRISESVQERLSHLLEAAHEVDRKIIALHPGGGGSAHRWPAEHYCALAAKLASETEMLLVITGVEAEMELCHQVSCAAGGSALNLCHRLSLEELAGLYSLCHLVVTNSTGPLHLARALGTPVLGLFPSDRAMTWKRWGPYGLSESAMTPPNGKPMADLSVEVVLRRVLDSLRRQV